ncbi:MAG: ABC transporter ATP-binding protein [Desulfobacter sp.]|nr:MAG: ABC transporter ATP-binding protein [Desulfobacter sp.]
MTDHAIDLKNVSYSIRTGFFLQTKPIIENLNLSLSRGQSMGFLGPNGAGKTTTIKLCAGIIQPNSGRVLIDNLPVTNIRPKKKIGLLTENQYIPTYLTVREWLEFLGGLSELSGKILKASVDHMLCQFDLEHLADTRIKGLSKGQTQRVGFAQAMLHDPDILLLDEPMSGMDPVWRSRIKEILIAYKNKGRTLLFSSHIMTDIFRLSDKITFIKSGKIKWQGNISEFVKNNTDYEVVFNVDNMDIIQSIAPSGPINRQPDGTMRMVISGDQKTEVIRLGAEKNMTIYSLTPLYQGIEELFYDTTRL